jgi:hypothetical protein
MEIFKTGGINVLPLQVSPDAALGSSFGMIIFSFAR